MLGTAGLDAPGPTRLFPTTGLLLAALPAGLLLAGLLLAVLLLVSSPRWLLAAELSLLTALRSASALVLSSRGSVLAALPTGLLSARLSLELPLLPALRLWRLLAPGLRLLPARLGGETVLSGVPLLAALTGLAALTRLAALLSELLLTALLGLLAGLRRLLPASLLARSPLLLHLVTPGRLGLLSASRLALLLLGDALLALVSRLSLGSRLALLAGVPGLRLLPPELAPLLALRRLLSGLARLPALLAELLGVAALLSRRGLLSRLALEPPLLASLLCGVARPLLASRCVLPPWLSLLAAPSLPALLAPLSAVLFASALGVAVLPAHIGSGGRTRSSE